METVSDRLEIGCRCRNCDAWLHAPDNREYEVRPVSIRVHDQRSECLGRIEPWAARRQNTYYFKALIVQRNRAANYGRVGRKPRSPEVVAQQHQPVLPSGGVLS